MAVFKIHKTQNFTIMSNHHLFNKELSLKGKGLLSVMLALPPTWDYSIAGLVTLSLDGETSIRSTLTELETCGYLKRVRIYENGKIIDWEYNIYEQPQNLHVGNQQLGFLHVENPPQLNTNKLNTKKVNKVNSATPSKLFNTSKEEPKKATKSSKWLSGKQKLLLEYNFSDDVHTQLDTYLNCLAEMGALVSDITLRAQLDKLIDKVPDDSVKCYVISSTITRGWKSIDYMINDLNKQKASSFDTAKPGAFTPKDPKNDNRHLDYDNQQTF